MAQPTVDGLTLDPGSGGTSLAGDTVGGKFTQIVLGAWSTGNGTMNVVTAAEPLPVTLKAGTAAIGKLAANDGVDVGDVDVTSIVPGTAATNLGKAIDSVVGATDTGIALLGKYGSDAAHLTTAEGDYDVPRLSDFGALTTAPEQHHVFDTLNATAGWAALNNDTINLATTTKHLLGTNALTFDKTDGAANTIFAAIAKTISSVDLGAVSPHDLIQTACYIPDLTDVAYVFVRLGTDSSHYNEWRIPDTSLTAATFETLVLTIGDASYAGILGNGWNPTAITYIVVGVAFDGQDDALAGIIFDELTFHTNLHTSAELNAEVSSSVSSANVNVQKVGGSATDKNSGNASNGSQRIVVATDDVNLAAIKTAAELLDDAVYIDDADWSDGASKHLLVGGLYQSAPQTITDGDVGPIEVDVNGRVIVSPSTALDVSAATVTVDLGANNDVTIDSSSIVKAEDAAHGSGDTGVMALTVRNDTLAALGGADGDYAPLQVGATGGLHTETRGAAAEDAAVVGAPVLTGGRYDAAARSLDDGDVGAIALTPEAAAFAAVAFQTDFVYDDGVKCQVKRSSTTEAANGTNALLAAVAGKKFRVLSVGVFATSATAVSFYFEDADNAAVLADSTHKFTVDLDGGGGPAGFVLDHNPHGWFETPTANKAFEINLSAATGVIVVLTYIEVA